jgi:hypothetical protein
MKKFRAQHASDSDLDSDFGRDSDDRRAGPGPLPRRFKLETQSLTPSRRLITSPALAAAVPLAVTEWRPPRRPASSGRERLRSDL